MHSSSKQHARQEKAHARASRALRNQPKARRKPKIMRQRPANLSTSMQRPIKRSPRLEALFNQQMNKIRIEEAKLRRAALPQKRTPSLREILHNHHDPRKGSSKAYNPSRAELRREENRQRKIQAQQRVLDKQKKKLIAQHNQLIQVEFNRERKKKQISALVEREKERRANKYGLASTKVGTQSPKTKPKLSSKLQNPMAAPKRKSTLNPTKPQKKIQPLSVPKSAVPAMQLTQTKTRSHVPNKLPHRKQSGPGTNKLQTSVNKTLATSSSNKNLNSPRNKAVSQSNINPRQRKTSKPSDPIKKNQTKAQTLKQKFKTTYQTSFLGQLKKLNRNRRNPSLRHLYSPFQSYDNKARPSPSKLPNAPQYPSTKRGKKGNSKFGMFLAPKPNQTSASNIPRPVSLRSTPQGQRSPTLRRAALVGRLHNYLFPTPQKHIHMTTSKELNQHMNSFQFSPLQSKPTIFQKQAFIDAQSLFMYKTMLESFPNILKQPYHPLHLLMKDKTKRMKAQSEQLYQKFQASLTSHVNNTRQRLLDININKTFQQMPPKILTPFQRRFMFSEFESLRRLTQFTPLFTPSSLDQLDSVNHVPVYFQHEQFAPKLNKNGGIITTNNNFYHHKTLKNKINRLAYLQNEFQASEQNWLRSILATKDSRHSGQIDKSWWSNVKSFSNVNTKSRQLAAYTAAQHEAQMKRNMDNISTSGTQTLNQPHLENITVLPQSNDDELFISTNNTNHVDGLDRPTDQNINPTSPSPSNSLPNQQLSTNNEIVHHISPTRSGFTTYRKQQRYSAFERTMQYIEKNCQIQSLPGEITSEPINYNLVPHLLMSNGVSGGSKTTPITKFIKSILQPQSKKPTIDSSSSHHNNPQPKPISTTAQTFASINKPTHHHTDKSSLTKFGNVGKGVIDGLLAAPLSTTF